MSGISSKADVTKLVKRIKSQWELRSMIGSLYNLAVALLQDAANRKKYHNLTGNTLTSLSAGIWDSFGNRFIVNAESALNLQPATRGTLPGGSSVARENAVVFRVYGTGRTKRLWGSVLRDNFIPTDERYGKDKATDFINTFNTSTYKKPLMVVCTGTEYSVFLEGAKSLNVLSDTANPANIWDLFKSNLVRI